MIKFENEKVILNQEDYNAISGIWGAFKSHLDYCAELLKHGSDNYDEYLKQKDRLYLETVSPDIDFKDYKLIFKKVFEDKNFVIIN